MIAIETKARSKSLRRNESVTVRYDGKKISFPDWTETRWLGQASANAKYLSKKLAQETGKRVWVRAVICLPGWYVSSEGAFEPHVCNPEMLPGWVLALPLTPLDEKQLNRIRGYVEKQVAIQIE